MLLLFKRHPFFSEYLTAIASFSRFLLFFFTVLCSLRVTVTSYGYYAFPLTSTTVVAIETPENATIILRHLSWPRPFLEALIENWAQETIEVEVDSWRNVIVSGSCVTLKVVGADYPESIEMWVIEQSRCPHIVFELPKSKGISFRLHSEFLTESVCTVVTEFPTIVASGVNASGDLEVYGGVNGEPLAIVDVCSSAFCRTKVGFPGIARFKIEKAEEAGMFFQILGSTGGEFSAQPAPLPFYNFSGIFEFGTEFDVVAIDNVCDLGNRQRSTVIAFVVAVCISVIFVVAGVVSRLVVRLDPIWSTVGLVSGQTEVVLNQYCPDSSARVIVPVST
jgi:hypothetical protein